MKGEETHILISDITKEQFEDAVKGAVSIIDVARRLGIRDNNGAHLKMQKLSQKYDIPLPVWDDAPSTAKKINRNALSDKEFFSRGIHRSGSTIRSRLIKIGRTYTCDREECVLHGKSKWNGESLTFQVDHIDGDNTNNELSNLRFLCPNCHSQTKTYGRKNTDKYEYCDCGRRKSLGVEGCPHQEGDPLLNPAKGDNALCGGCNRRKRARGSLLCRECRLLENRSNPMGRKKVQWPPVEAILEGLNEKGYNAYSKEIGVSGGAIRKHLRSIGFEELPPGKYGRKS